MAGVAIDVVGVTKIFGGGQDGSVRALDEVSVRIMDNEFFTLLGPSGCGKTTLLRLIAGFEEPTAGKILLHGQPIEGLPPYRRPVNTVFQSYALFPHMTVAQNIGFGLEMKGVDRARIRSRVADMIALVKLTGMEGRRPSQLSGGQQQRVALARALASEPQVLLLDEPLSALDLKLRKEMQIELKRLQTETGITFIFVTHDQEEALTMSDRIAVMDHGHILQIGSPREIYDHPTRRFVADFIGETNFLPVAFRGSEGAIGRWAHDGVVLIEGPAPSHPLDSGAAATLAFRPERVALIKDEGAEATLSGIVDTVVYAGTDTTFHVRLKSGTQIRARVQNRSGHAQDFAVGDPVAIGIAPDAIQILFD